MNGLLIKEVAAMRPPTTFDGPGSVMALLQCGVSLALLLDLAAPLGPPSDELYNAELASA